MEIKEKGTTPCLAPLIRSATESPSSERVVCASLMACSPCRGRGLDASPCAGYLRARDLRYSLYLCDLEL